MTYQMFLRMEDRLSWMYAFHPEFFLDIDESERAALRKCFLYDVDDEYPDSIEDYYNQVISVDSELQRKAILAMQHLYELSSSGNLKDAFPDLSPGTIEEC